MGGGGGTLLGSLFSRESDDLGSMLGFPDLWRVLSTRIFLEILTACKN